MFGLGTLIFGAMFAGSAAKCAIEDASMLSKPCGYLDDGTPIYIDRKCNEYINGERVVTEYNYQLERTQKRGVKTGKIYYDSVVATNTRMSKQDKDEIEYALKGGKLAYNKWIPSCQRKLTVELSTDKIIAGVYQDEYKGIFRKFYLKNKPVSEHIDPVPDDDDFGIPITYNEAKNLCIAGKTFRDIYFDEKIGTEKDPYYKKENKLLFEQQDGYNRIGSRCKGYISKNVGFIGNVVAINTEYYLYNVEHERTGEIIYNIYPWQIEFIDN